LIWRAQEPALVAGSNARTHSHDDTIRIRYHAVGCLDLAECNPAWRWNSLGTKLYASCVRQAGIRGERTLLSATIASAEQSRQDEEVASPHPAMLGQDSEGVKSFAAFIERRSKRSNAMMAHALRRNR